MKFFLDNYYKNGQLLNNHYEILKLIGSGSFGMVYLCRDVRENEIRVVKQLRTSKRIKKDGLHLFTNEISILKKMNHPNLPKLYNSFSLKKNYFYVMNYIEADNIDDQIFSHNKTFNEEESLSTFSKLLKMVDYLHNQHIYHQDLRIPNIMLKESEPFLIDFGLAKDMSKTWQNQRGEVEKMKQQDYYDLGDILLFLLYTTYSTRNKKALPWTEELTLEQETVYLLKRLLGIEKRYDTTSEIKADFKKALQACRKQN
ncbi:protein kinase domain-containing protein [Oceanobacillus rekensis]|uniref:protein kinase domain-containing protein n=1 Tax=Oceanobacillus rekensis TaxID=937927 RepID=UPI001594419F|nr:protein kinase [Oceanobacillus rekensis]